MTEKKTKSTARPRKVKADPEAEVLETIAAMPQPDRGIGERLHEIILASAPELSPKLWYGQPAYAAGGKVVCFFRGAAIDKERYLTLGFSSEANLDDGHMWPTAYALTEVTTADEKRIAALVEQAAKQR